MTSIEIELFHKLLIPERQISCTVGYETDHFYVRQYVEDSKYNECNRYQNVIAPMITEFAKFLNAAKYIEFLCPSVNKEVDQTVGGSAYGFWLRRTVSYNFTGDLNPCPKHVATKKNDGYYGSDDLNNCPKDCDHDSTPRFGPGTEIFYDVIIRSEPRLHETN